MTRHRVLNAFRLLWDVIRIVCAGRAIVVLAVAFLLLGPATVAIRHATGAFDRALPTYFFDAPTIPALWENHSSLHAGTSFLLAPASLAAFFQSGEGPADGTLRFNGLDQVYRILVALLMLLIGANVLPQNEAVYASLFTVPARKAAHYLLHAAALAVLVFVLLGAAFLVNAGVVRAIHGPQAGPMRLLFDYHVLLALYGAAFAGLGLFLAAAVRRRPTALMIGVATALLLIAVAPQAYYTSALAYRDRHAETLAIARDLGEVPNDAWYRVNDLLSLTPAAVYTQSTLNLLYIARYGDTSCASCGPSSRQRAIDRGRIALAATAAGFLVLGGIAFQRKAGRST